MLNNKSVKCIMKNTLYVCSPIRFEGKKKRNSDQTQEEAHSTVAWHWGLLTNGVNLPAGLQLVCIEVLMWSLKKILGCIG